MANYRDPKTIYSPRDMITDVDVIFEDHDTVSIAKIKWNDSNVIGIRWNIALREWDDTDKMNGTKECLGLPISRGYPTWFILPDQILDKNSDIRKAIDSIKL
ncbi:hypothetical protein [Amniculibacterium sp. G2-70]|uniref:hypothetical protein n=1 Tax=Amniculibacterium sp. G2-70 TaxID=2767188 RepID=UPI001654981D|nr:hypothetical protein [Amniculibacterium sp. G2-70]